jgi:hypothetical protein
MKAWIQRGVVSLFVLGAAAGCVRGAGGQADDLHWPKGPDITEPEPWREQGVALPAYPRAENLLEVSVDDAGAGMRYLLDSASLAVGEDGVVRYTLVIESRGGARNVLFEGLRCEVPEYRTYAIGTPEDTFREVSGSGWELIPGRGLLRYRAHLRDLYFCRGGRASTPRQILDRVRYAQLHHHHY